MKNKPTNKRKLRSADNKSDAVVRCTEGDVVCDLTSEVLYSKNEFKRLSEVQEGYMPWAGKYMYMGIEDGQEVYKKIRGNEGSENG